MESCGKFRSGSLMGCAAMVWTKESRKPSYATPIWRCSDLRKCGRQRLSFGHDLRRSGTREPVIRRACHSTPQHSDAFAPVAESRRTDVMLGPATGHGTHHDNRFLQRRQAVRLKCRKLLTARGVFLAAILQPHAFRAGCRGGRGFQSQRRCGSRHENAGERHRRGEHRGRPDRRDLFCKARTKRLSDRPYPPAFT